MKSFVSNRALNLLNNLKVPSLFLVALSTFSLSTTADAASQLHFDLNAVSVNATPALTAANAGTYTGIITVAMDASPASFLEGMDIDNVVQPISGTLTAVSGVLNMTNGAISSTPGSTLTFTIKNSDNSLHVFTGTLREIDSNGAFINSDANPSLLDSSNFAGVNVSQWANRTVDSAAIFSNFSGSSANLDVFIVPEPVLGWAAVALLGSLGIRRRQI